MKCALCGQPIKQPVWSDDPRLPYCGPDCLATARAVDHSIPPAIDRAVRRDHSLCGIRPCSDCR